jgi:hypothetical protein
VGRQRQFATIGCSRSADELVAVVGRHARTTAVANSDLLDDLGEGQVPKWTGRSPRKPPQAPLGRQRKFATFGCGRSAAIETQSSIDTGE